MRQTTLLLYVCLLLSACNKNNGAGDSEAPVVSFTSPTNLATFSTGQKVRVQASVSDNDKLMSIHLNIEGPEFIHLAYGESGKNRDISEEILIAKSGKYLVSVEAYDKAGNKGSAKAEITVN